MAKLVCTLFLICCTLPSFAADVRISRLNDLEKRLSTIEHNMDSSLVAEISELTKQMRTAKKALRAEEHAVNKPIDALSGLNLNDQFELIDLFVYDWTSTSYRIIARIRSNALIYAEWVKLYFYFYKNNLEVFNDYTYIDYETYGFAGVLPFHDSFLETYVDKVAYDRLQVAIRYDLADGKDAILCDQVLQQLSNSLTPYSPTLKWEGAVNNSSTYSVEFPRIHAKIMRSDSLVDVDNTYLDTECQGNRSVIIDYVIDSPLEAQEIVLRNCRNEDINLSGWYLGDKATLYSTVLPNNTIIKKNSYLSFTNKDIHFTIDQSDEIIYLFDKTKNMVDQWTKDENEDLLAPLTTVCYQSYLDPPADYDQISYVCNYALHSLKGEGNLTPNAPVFTRSSYNLAPKMEYTFQLFVIDPNKEAVEIQIDWGDGVITGWLGFTASGSLGSFKHAFDTEGTFQISARNRDSHGATSSWSDSTTVWVSRFVPIELAAFSAHLLENQVLLNWSTTAESNNLGFYVDRSSDRQVWQEIAFIPGHGTSHQVHDYSTIDSESPGGRLLYRLRQIDYDGSEHLSDTVTLILPVMEYALKSIYPNPFNQALSIHFQLAEASEVRMEIFNLTGQRVAELVNGQLNRGDHRIIWNAQNTPVGTFIIRFQAGHSTLLGKCLLLK
ncbi:MAG: T9SS C-terminal target domain-containing protein [Calditrichaeota bacterium]|nr:MAG: T9SS C-terminal target domain-containing protein [Calditrichota bacterium]